MPPASTIQPASGRADLEWTPCNLCDADDTDLRYDFAPLRIVECRRCGLVYTNPRSVVSPAEFYDSEFWAAYEEGYELNLPMIRLVTRKWITELARRSSGPRMRVAELGSGLGAFLAEAQALGHEVYGIEPSPHAIEYARSRFGLDNVFEGTAAMLPDLPLPEVDAFVMLATIEHLPDPRGTLKHASRLLAPRGLLLISTGVWGCFNHRVAGTRWTIIAPEGHLYYFSKRTLRKLLERAGFEQLCLWTNGALVNTLTDSRFLVRLFNNRFTDLLRLGWFVSKLGLGDEMFVIARKGDGRPP